jgi:hypothetical protein
LIAQIRPLLSDRTGDYVIHNPLLVDTDVYASWYSDGVRVIDTSDPTAPREVAYFVPPSANNPVSPSQRGVLNDATQVWRRPRSGRWARPETGSAAAGPAAGS